MANNQNTNTSTISGDVKSPIIPLLVALREQKEMKMKGGVVPFIITDELKMFYYRGLCEWGHIDGYFIDTCLSAQDNYKAILDYFRIKYE